ncbi:MAG: DUF1600 domain-containing protein [Mycoplasmoidaceae bacterium]
MENLDSNKNNYSSSNQIHFNNKDNFFTRLKKNYRTFDLVNYLCLFGVLNAIIILFFTSYDFINYALTDRGDKVWFGIIDRFTTQSNWIVGAFFILYFFNPDFQIFKGNKFLISTMAYIFFTFFGYNIVLVLISGGYGYEGDAYDISSNVWWHIIMPLYFIFFGLVKLWLRPNGEYKSFWSTFASGMIYPTIYTFYAITIPFIYRELNSEGVYETYSVYGFATNTKDEPTSWIYVCLLYFIFFPGSLVLFYYYKNLVKKFSKK